MTGVVPAGMDFLFDSSRRWMTSSLKSFVYPYFVPISSNIYSHLRNLDSASRISLSCLAVLFCFVLFSYVTRVGKLLTSIAMFFVQIVIVTVIVLLLLGNKAALLDQLEKISGVKLEL